MSGRWEGSNRRNELPPGWYTRIRPRILRRDRHVCQWRMAVGGICGQPANQVDHVGDPHDHRDANLQALCEKHHRRKSSQQGNAAHRRRPSRHRPPEPHPGAINRHTQSPPRGREGGGGPP